MCSSASFGRFRAQCFGIALPAKETRFGRVGSSRKRFGAGVDIGCVNKRDSPALTRIVVDSRERRSGLPELLASHDHVDLSFAELAVGDYVVDDRAVFERKTVDDFAKSIVDTRRVAG